MTYEEAKRIIIRHRLLFASMPDEVLEALDFFMKHDQAVDCISREQALEAIDAWDKFGYSARYGLERLDKDDKDKGYVPYVHYEDIENCIKNLPSVTPQEPRKGHWIGHREHCENLGVMPSGLGAYEWCSNCDCGIDVWEWHRNNYNFCPNCGADMREVEQ